MKNKIPQKIHYFWFGNGKKPKILEKCIKSWQKYLPEYEIIEWNETNFDIEQSKYCKDAYEAKKYAYVADYARFKILYEHGGIYFDTDVELLKKIPDNFFEEEGFIGVEDVTYLINPGLVFASIPKQKIIKEILDLYEEIDFKEQYSNLITVCVNTTKIFEKYGFKQNNEFQTIKNIKIYPTDYFCSYDIKNDIPKITKNSISIHHYSGSWMSGKNKFKLILKRFIRNTIGVKKYEQITRKIKKRK